MPGDGSDYLNLKLHALAHVSCDFQSLLNARAVERHRRMSCEKVEQLKSRDPSPPLGEQTEHRDRTGCPIAEFERNAGDQIIVLRQFFAAPFSDMVGLLDGTWPINPDPRGDVAVFSGSSQMTPQGRGMNRPGLLQIWQVLQSR